MNMLKKYLLMLSVAAFVFASCSEEDQPKKEKDGIIASQSDPDLDVTDLQGKVTGDITLSADENWILNGPLVVAAGGKLTIEAGTTIKATPGTTTVYIAVERNGEIQAVGTEAEPITITSNADVPEAGDWGGLLIMGNSVITGNVAGATAVTEVVDFIYGNNPVEAADDSGDLAYLILEYTGARINGEKEFNGLTLYAVGSETSISNIAILNGDDDGIEFFGGTVNVSNILVVNATDDMFDYTQGYKGTITNAYGIREASYTKVSTDPRGIEGDGNLDGLTPGLANQSNPTFTNVTIVNNAAISLSDVVKIRRNSAGSFTNIQVIFGAAAIAPGDFVDCTDTVGDAAAGASITISGTGTNLDTNDNKVGVNNSTISVAATTGVSTSTFSWSGYAF
jgi:hypothetical protein